MYIGDFLVTVILYFFALHKWLFLYSTVAVVVEVANDRR